MKKLLMLLFLLISTCTINADLRVDFSIGKSTISVQREDILQVHADAIVNPANSSLKQGGGVCGLIFNAAGSQLLTKECQEALKKRGMHFLQEGDVVETSSCNLAGFKKIFHVVPPNFNSKNKMQQYRLFDEDGKLLLRQSYINLVRATAVSGVQSIVIPFLSGGNFCRNESDLPEMAEIAIDAMKDVFSENQNYSIEVKFVLFSESDFRLFRDCIQKK